MNEADATSASPGNEEIRQKLQQLEFDVAVIAFNAAVDRLRRIAADLSSCPKTRTEASEPDLRLALERIAVLPCIKGCIGRVEGPVYCGPCLARAALAGTVKALR